MKRNQGSNSLMKGEELPLQEVPNQFFFHYFCDIFWIFEKN
jgi:hypothetical protein